MKTVLVVIVCLLTGGAADAETIRVAAGGNLQAALTSAEPGDTILLTPGATYVGNFVLPNKGGSSFITVQTAFAGLPDASTRVAPADAPWLAKLRSPNGEPALRTAAGAHHWRIVLIEFLANAGGAGDIIALGDWLAQNTLASVPHDLVIDRCYIHADPGSPQKRGIALNSASTTITRSYIAGIKSDWQDSQAIGGWNGPGPYTIANNYLEASGENVMFGGGDPAIPNLVPSDITVTGNLFSKPTAWRSENWVVKNLFELKNARRVTIRDNTFEYNWQAAQSGFAILFTVRNQDGGCPWCQVEDVVFEDNIVRHVAAGVNILGFDNNHPSLQTRRITIRNNLFFDIDPARWGGTGRFLQLLGGAVDVTVDHNTIIQEGVTAILWAEGPPISGFTFTNNLVRHNAYGIIGDGRAPGFDTIDTYLPSSVIARNVIADASSASYPASNLFPSSEQFRAEFVSYAADDYRLVSGSSWRVAGLDGRDLGALLEQPVSVSRPVRGDVDGDGKADLVWRHTQTGDVGVTLMDGTTVKERLTTVAPGVPLAWRIVGVDDLDGDGKTDLVWRDTGTGDVAVWLFNGVAVKQTPVVALGVPLAWQIVGVGDLDDDGKADLVWRQAQTGDVAVWLMNGATVRQTPVIAPGVPLAWQIVDVGDVNGDGKADLVWRQSQTGDVAVWLMDGSTVLQAPIVAAGVPLTWQIVGMGDLDGDGQADLVWRDTQRGDVAVWLMDGATVLQVPIVSSGVPLGWQIVAVQDLDGDGKTDLVWRHTQTADVAVWLMNGATISQAPAVIVGNGVPLAWQFQ